MNAFPLYFIMIIFSSPAFAYKFLCRGPFVITGNTTSILSGGPSITFKKSPQAAINDGQSLSPGSCAWADRPVGANEPNVLSLRPSTGEINEEMTLDIMYAKLKQDQRYRSMVEDRLNFFSRSDYVVEVDALQSGDSPKYFYITDSFFRADAFLRLIPVTK